MNANILSRIVARNTYLQFLYKNQTVQKILQNTGWLFFDRFLRFGIAILVSAWIARHLGPEQYGRFNYALAFVALFSPLANLGLDSIVVRNLVRDPTFKNEILGTTFLLKQLGSVVMFLVVLGSIVLIRPGDNSLFFLVLILAGASFFQAVDTIDLWFQSRVESRYSVIVKVFVLLLVTLVRIILILLDASLVAFALALFIEYVLGAIGMVIVYNWMGQQVRSWKPSVPLAMSLMKDSLPLLLSGIAILIYMKIDTVMLGQMVDDKTVGLYSVATRLSELWYFIPMAIASSTFPSIVESKKMDPGLYKSRVQKLLSVMAFLAIAISISITFLSGWLVNLMFGKIYSAAGSVLAVHIWASLSVFLGVIRESWLTTEGLMVLSFITTLVGAIVNIILNLFLIPYYGAMGAAIATVVAYFLVVFIVPFFHPRARVIQSMIWKSLLFRGFW